MRHETIKTPVHPVSVRLYLCGSLGFCLIPVDQRAGRLHERFCLARVVDDRGRDSEVKEWKRSRKEIGAWWWLRARGRGEVDEISIYTTPHS